MKEVQREMSVKVNISVKQKKVKLPTGARLLIRRACAATLSYEKLEGAFEVEVSVVDDEAIREINREYRKVDSATDVLSFPLGENGVYDVNPETDAKMLGDIVISIDRTVSQARLYGHGFERELAYLTVHSMLHLLGYDHINGGLEKTIMREKEEDILETIGLAINKV